MKVLVTGKDGQVGRELQRSLAVLADVVAVGRADCDFSDADALRRLVRDVRPDVVINPAAYTAVDKAESDAAYADAVNHVGPGLLAEEAQRLGALFIHFSTDYVYDGRKDGRYTEADQTGPLGVYGSTKLAGELAVSRACRRHVILRTSWVFGAHGRNFLKTILRAAQQRETLHVVADQTGSPTSSALLADLTAHLVRAQQGPTSSPAYGVFNVAAAGETTWFEFAVYAIDRARDMGVEIRVPRSGILAVTTAEYPTVAERPRNSLLDTSKFQEAFRLRLPDWRVGVDETLDRIFRSRP
jgi:dTDP-4-dehydrorhamnose reductase